MSEILVEPKTKRSKKSQETNQTWDMKSKKFLSYSISATIGTAIFFFLLTRNGLDHNRLYENFFEYHIWILGIYVGGNSTEKIATRFANRR